MGMSPPDDFVSTNVEITSKTYLGKLVEKKNVFALDFLYAGVVFVFINNTFDWVWFFQRIK